MAPKPIEGCSPRINQAILQAMAKAPGDRFSSAGAFLAALEGSGEAALELPIRQPDALDRLELWAKSHKLLLSLGCLGLLALPLAALFFLMPLNAPRTPLLNPVVTHSAQPDFGKRLSLPEDMDVVPEVTNLPAPVPLTSTVEAMLPGPHHARISWTALIDTGYELNPWVDGVGPDGTVYVREERLNSLWAISKGVLRWGFRAPDRPGLLMLNPLIPPNGHADFRDPGRMWLAWCPDGRHHSCSGAVFNASGAGGHTDRVPSGFGQPVDFSDTTMPFFESDAQNWRWPQTNARLLCTSRLNTVSLTNQGSQTNRDERWTVPLDGRATLAIQQAAGLIVSTAHGAIYAFDNSGQVRWTYQAGDAPENLQIMPSGDLVILEKDRETLSCIRAGKLRWRYRCSDLVDEFDDHITGARRLAVADTQSSLYLLTESGASATLAIDRDGKLLWQLPWAAYVQYGGLSLDSRGRLFFTFQLYQIDKRARGGVICISDKSYEPGAITP